MAVRVLVVDDEWLPAAALRQQLEACGYEVVGMTNTGRRALELMVEVHPDLVVMDVQMPEMDGLSATRELMRTHPHPVVILTGQDSACEAAAQAGAMGFALKPILPGQVCRMMEAARARFARFEVIHRGAASCDEALRIWADVQRAVGGLMAREQMTEEAAFARLQQLASDRQLSIGTVAREQPGR